MIFPIGDAPNPRGFTPWVTWGLIAVNVLVYLLFTLPLASTQADFSQPVAQDYLRFLESVVPRAQIPMAAAQASQWDLVVYELGFRPSHPQPTDLFTSMFMHAGFAHLLGNMVFLWIYGDNVEHRLGRLPFLLTYLGTGIAATLSFAWLAGGAPTPLVGASGAISGVLGVYFVSFPRNVVKLFAAFPPFFLNVFLLPAWVVLGAYVLFSNLLPLLSGAASNVAYGAHLGGFAAGLAVALPLAYGVGRFGGKRESTGKRARDRAGELESSGQPRRALAELRRAAAGAEGTERAELQLAIGRLLARHGRRTEAYQWLHRALQHPSTASDARHAIRDLKLDPRLLARLGV